MDEADSRAVWIRIYRILKCADCLSEARFGFVERHSPSGFFSEVPFGSTSGYPPQQAGHGIQPPNRRNVALQSIFSQLSTEPTYREFSSPKTATSPDGSNPSLPVGTSTTEINAPFMPLSSFSQAMGVTPIPSNAFEDNDGDEFIGESDENYPSYGYVGKAAASATGVCTDSDKSPQASKLAAPEPFLSLSSTDLSRPSEADQHTDFSHLFCSIWTPRQADMSKSNTDGWAT